MAYTERVSVSGTALSFLYFECSNSQHAQEGLLLGEVTSQVTSHISDSHSDNSRLETEIAVRSVLPLPAVAHFYQPSGRVREERVAELAGDAAPEVVGWYHYRRHGALEPTLRDRLVTRGLQRYFERTHGRSNFVICGVTSKESSSGSTHTFAYRFGKINCLDVYERIEDATANLGEKMSGYRRAQRRSHGVFNKIFRDINIDSENSNDAIHKIQKAVDARLLQEAQAALKTEKEIKELEAEIEQMTAIMAERHCADVQAAVDKKIKEDLDAREKEIAKVCADALNAQGDTNLINFSEYISEQVNATKDREIIQVKEIERPLSPILPIKVAKNYAAALRNTAKAETASSSTNNTLATDNLIDLDMEPDDKQTLQKPIALNDCIKISDSSPEY